MATRTNPFHALKKLIEKYTAASPCRSDYREHVGMGGVHTSYCRWLRNNRTAMRDFLSRLNLRSCLIINDLLFFSFSFKYMDKYIKIAVFTVSKQLKKVILRRKHHNNKSLMSSRNEIKI